MYPETPHANRLRAGRRSRDNQIYLITTVTCQRNPIFNEFSMGRAVVRALRTAEQSAYSLAFVVMPDHLHWLMQLRECYSLSNVVHFVKSVSASSINRMRNNRGAVWQKGYHDHAVRREEDLQALARYIIYNPVRAGMVKSASQYPLWDSAWL